MTAAAGAMTASAPAATLTVSDAAAGGRELRLAGRLDAYSIAGVWHDARAALAAAPERPIVIDASRVDYCDGAGIAMLIDLLRQPRAAGAPVSLSGLRPEFQALLDQFDPAAMQVPVEPHVTRVNVVAEIGRAAAITARDIRAQVAFIGETASALWYAARNPAHVRWKDVWYTCEQVGVNALPIVASDLFPPRHHPGFPGCGADATVRRRALCRRPRRAFDPARARPADDGDPARRTVGCGICRRDRYDESERGIERADDHGARPGALPGGDPDPRSGADGAAADAVRGPDRHTRRRVDDDHLQHPDRELPARSRQPGRREGLAGRAGQSACICRSLSPASAACAVCRRRPAQAPSAYPQRVRSSRASSCWLSSTASTRSSTICSTFDAHPACPPIRSSPWST